MEANDIIKILKENKCRITNPRRIIVEVLAKNESMLLSAEDILEQVVKIDDTINLTTVYRNIEQLEKLNLLYSRIPDGKTHLYKLICMNHHHHHHITCTNCGIMRPIDYCPVSPELTNVTQSEGFEMTGHSLELYGICSDCRKSDDL